MRFTIAGSRLCRVIVFALASGAAAAAQAQGHDHTPGVSGMPQGIPFFCAGPTVTSTGSGDWSKPGTWSTNKVPGANDKIAIAAGHTVTYDATSDAKLTCIEVRGHLAFATAANTRMKVVTIMVPDGGYLEIGSPAKPVAPDVKTEIVFADQAFDHVLDPAELGNGIVSLGKVTMHGAVKTPTFIRLSREPLAGQTTLAFEKPVTGWKAGDALAIPDTRQLPGRAAGTKYQYAAQDERLQIASVSGAEVTLAAPLKYDHKGARNADGKLEFLPHVGNVSRNVILRSENPAGTRGHTLFIYHADIDLRYAQFSDMGRTRMGALNSVDLNSENQAVRVGTNQIGRYAVHFHHDFGPKQTPSNGYQFTVVGNAVDSSQKWGITIHHSSYGLIQDNVVYNSRGAGIVAEDGTESYNLFDHNFSLRSGGSGGAVANSGYGPVGDPGGEGAGFWFRGPNNRITNNVAANGDEFGFGLPPIKIGLMRTPAFKGADTSVAAESDRLDTTYAPVLEFSNNEAYGAIQTGVSFGWSGTITNFTVWHAARHAVTGTPTDTLTLDKLTVRGDASVLGDKLQNPIGVWIANYLSKKVVVSNASVEGVRIGVSSPFFYSETPDPRRAEGSLLIENGHFRTNIGVSVATAHTVKGREPLKSAIVRGSLFEPLKLQAAGLDPSETISMNYGMPPRDVEPRDPIVVYDYNKQPGNNFKIYYSNEAPETAAPCHETLPGIGGWVCK